MMYQVRNGNLLLITVANQVPNKELPFIFMPVIRIHFEFPRFIPELASNVLSFQPIIALNGLFTGNAGDFVAPHQVEALGFLVELFGFALVGKLLHDVYETIFCHPFAFNIIQCMMAR